MNNDIKYSFGRQRFAILLLIVLLMCFSSCKKSWLDAKPKQNLVVPSTLEDFQALIDYADQLNFSSPNLHEIASDGHYTTETAWAGLSGNNPNNAQRNAYVWTHERTYIAGSVAWAFAYQNIFTCNIVLEGLRKLNPSNLEERRILNDVKGQALMHRAVEFFVLAQVWAQPYSDATADNALGIPLRVESDMNVPITRNNVKNTYNQIIKDLTEAAKLLPSNLTNKTRPSKPAAFGELARVYLAMEDYGKAGAYADSCLRLYNTLLNFNSDINVAATAPISRFNAEVIWHESLAGNSFLTTNCFIDQTLYDSYHNDDLRKKAFFVKNANGTISFKGNYTGSTTTRFSGLASDELYLIRAECNARAGDVTEAISDLNTLLKKRWDNKVIYPEVTAVDANDALAKVLNERKKELLLRGLRWSDLRRLNKDERFKITISRTIGDKTYTLEPNSYKYTFPLPDDTKEQTGMPETPGW